MDSVATLTAAVLLLLMTIAGDAIKWDDLRVRFGRDPQSNFVQMPRTVADAIRQGFKKETGCNGAANKFLGQRYVQTNGDRSVMLLFDVNGIIAGIQTPIPKSTGYPTARNKEFFDVWIEEANVHVLTAYFVKPSIICNGGRNLNQLETEGTGTELHIQKGRATSNAGLDTFEIPRTEEEMSRTKWIKGKCVVFMGMHYWYNMKPDMDCENMLPYFALYNNGRLDAFGFSMGAFFPGNYYEYPTVPIANTFFPFTPACMHAPSFPYTMTSMHVYLHKKPWTRFCS